LGKTMSNWVRTWGLVWTDRPRATGLPLTQQAEGDEIVKMGIV